MEDGAFTQAGGPVQGSADNSSSSGRAMAKGGETCGSMLRIGSPLGGETIVCKAGHVMVRGSSCVVCVGQRQLSSQLEISSFGRVGTGCITLVFSIGDSSGFWGNPYGISHNPSGVSSFLGHSLLGSLPQEYPIYSSSMFSPPILLDEVHSLLADFGTDQTFGGLGHISQSASFIEPADLPALPSFRQSEGFETREEVLGRSFLASSSSKDHLVPMTRPISDSPLSSNEARAGAQGPKKKKPRAVRKKRVHSLALGAGVVVVDMPIYVDRALVGHARGRNLSRSFLRKWVEENWGSQLSTLLVVNKLMKGWFSFLMASKDDANRVVLGRWEMAGVPIVLRKWSLVFDVAKERAGKEPIWVKLPGLPIHL